MKDSSITNFNSNANNNIKMKSPINIIKDKSKIKNSTTSSHKKLSTLRNISDLNSNINSTKRITTDNDIKENKENTYNNTKQLTEETIISLNNNKNKKTNKKTNADTIAINKNNNISTSKKKNQITKANINKNTLSNFKSSFNKNNNTSINSNTLKTSSNLPSFQQITEIDAELSLLKQKISLLKHNYEKYFLTINEKEEFIKLNNRQFAGEVEFIKKDLNDLFISNHHTIKNYENIEKLNQETFVLNEYIHNHSLFKKILKAKESSY